MRLPYKLLCFTLIILVNISYGQKKPISKFKESISPNLFSGTDSERIQKAINEGQKLQIPVKIGINQLTGKAYWSLDQAILLPSNTMLFLENCTLQLSDSCRDNMFRTSNVGENITDPKRNENIHIEGIGQVTLKGANNPRSTGDGGRTLSLDPESEIKKGNWRISYGTDAGNPSKKQTGDWRNIMILIAQTKNFSLKNIKLENSHAWGISFERTSDVILNQISIYNPEEITINNKLVKVFNKDGIDLRQGCKNFSITNISGFTGDDFIALSSLDVKGNVLNPATNGSLHSTMVTKSRWYNSDDDTENIYISNINCESVCRAIAIRASDSASVHHVYITNVFSREKNGVGGRHNALLIGGKGYGTSSIKGKINNIFLHNLVTFGQAPVLIEAPISNCHFSNIQYTGNAKEIIEYKINKSEIVNVGQSYTTITSN